MTSEKMLSYSLLANSIILHNERDNTVYVYDELNKLLHTDKQVACSVRRHDPLKRSRREITRRITDLETFLTFLMMHGDCTDHSEDTETTTSNRWSEYSETQPQLFHRRAVFHVTTKWELAPNLSI
ncbi:hypothetical protein Tsp_01569 [Trichinella spiralis]|uniref:hypothetical protein n=1 Tax=Trichinella spiralis TaxID=6334 RepID=UPI0001EFC08B|nr:hypothetical protein Tsp_01569 [Trichinella spiralis]